ncbi:MAG: hypothetical protein AAGA42_21090 [Actinomycetota bacterium]
MNPTLEIRIRTVAWTVTVAALSIAATFIVASAWSADAAPGDIDSTYVPTAGCRAFDFRPAPTQVGPRSTPLGAGEVYSQQITGGVGKCTGPLAIPGDAVAVAMNVTAVDATAQTNLRLFPADLVEVPLLSNLNVSAGQAPFANKVDVTLSPGGAIKIFNQNGSVSVVGDIVGYYTNSSLTEITSRLSTLEASHAALEAAQPFTVVSEPVFTVILEPTPTEVRKVTVTAPVDGHVVTNATGYMIALLDSQVVDCAVMGSVSDPPGPEELIWQSPTGGDYAHLSASRVFDIDAGETATYYLVCNGLNSFIGAPRLTAIFTPAL